MKFARSVVLVAGMAALLSSVIAQVVAGEKEGSAVVHGYADTHTCPPIQPPDLAKDAHRKAMSFAFLIGVNGEVMQSKLTQSSHDKDFDHEVLQAFQKCTFHPAIFQGKPVISWVMLSYK